MKYSESRCWHCNRRLVVQNGKPVYSTVKTQDGHEVKVHMKCVEGAKRDISPPTAVVHDDPTTTAISHIVNRS